VETAVEAIVQAVFVPAAAIDAVGETFFTKPAVAQSASNVFAITSGLTESAHPMFSSTFVPDLAVNFASSVAIVTSNFAACGVLPNHEQLSEAGATEAPVVAPTYALIELVEPVSARSTPRYLAESAGAKVIDDTTGLMFQPHQGGTTTVADVLADPAVLSPSVGVLLPAAKPDVTPESATTIPNIDAAIPILVAVIFEFII
jgi:hypothetical protein